MCQNDIFYERADENALINESFLKSGNDIYLSFFFLVIGFD